MAEEKRVNLKAAKFQKYLDDNKLTFFRRDASNDEADTIVFQSNIQVEGQTLPVIIITDSTIYTIIRVQVGAGLVKEDNHVKFGEYLNGLNRSYKVFNDLLKWEKMNHLYQSALKSAGDNPNEANTGQL